MTTRALSIAFAALASFALANQTAPQSLERISKLGDEVHYRFHAKLDISGTLIELEGKTLERTTKVNEDGSWEFESTNSEVKVKTPDGEQEISDESKVKILMGKDRAVSRYGDEGDEDSSSIRLQLLQTIKRPDKPVSIGDKWSATLTYKSKETFPVKADYEAVAIEKIGDWETMKVKVEAKETEGEEKASSSGFVWIILADGVSAKEELKISRAPFQFSPEPIDMSILIERTK